VHSLQALHTFAIASNCQSLLVIDSEEQLYEIDYTQPFCLLGEGSNTVFMSDFNGLVIKIANRGVYIEEQRDAWCVRCAAGENWHQFVLHLLDKGINGFENLALIPGTVGAAPVQNIGAYGVELSQYVDQVEGYHLETKTRQTLTAKECQFGYRDSIFKQALHRKFIITYVSFTLPKVWQPKLDYGPLQELCNTSPSAKQVCDKVIKIRQSKLPDPTVLPNSGSFFKNPIIAVQQAKTLQQRYKDIPIYPVSDLQCKLAAGWLIENVGLKGKVLGNVGVYSKQALVLVNHAQGDGQALEELIRCIQRTVWTKFNIALEHEVRLMGHSNEITIREVDHA
jgi:UDP-N-acetylmuramate dehydrogenase